MKTSNKKASNFLVLNEDQNSSDNETNMKTSHKHLVPVHDDEKEEENESDDDIANEDGTNTDDEGTESDNDYKGVAFLQDYVLSSIQVKPAISRIWILLDNFMMTTP